MSNSNFKTIGIDVSFKSLDVCIGQIDLERNITLSKPLSLSNNLSGFDRLLKNIKKVSSEDTEILVIMEATGIYHENLAYYLTEHSVNIAIVLPNVMSNYMKSLSLKQLDDKTCARAIAQFGLERKLPLWKAPNPNYSHMRELTRERSQIIEERTEVKNRLHALNNKAKPINSSIQRAKDRITFLNNQEKQITKEIKKLVDHLDDIKENVAIIESIPGMGFLSAVTILAETNNFDLIKNKKQLTSYAGLDVICKTSGSSINSKNRISKKGNKYLRKSLYFPALSAIRFTPKHKAMFIRITLKTGIKMKAAVAVQRKLLELSYTLIKNKTHYIENYEESRAPKKNQDSTQDRMTLLPYEV